MKLTYTEKHSKDARFSIRVTRQLFSRESKFQKIDIMESREFGRFLTLDGLMMLTEKDEFIYHDMIVHVAMASNPDIRRVLVIGGGDGGTVRELCRYDTVQHIDLVEIDKMVIEASRKYLKQTACCLDDPRVRIHIADGLPYVRGRKNSYDLIIVDSTDPFGPGEELFTREFYGNCFLALKDDGILINQHESPFYDKYASSMYNAHRCISYAFPICRVYQAHIPTYPSGHWLFGFASKSIDPVRDFTQEKQDLWNARGIRTGYYNTDLHIGAFALPTYVKELLENKKEGE